METKDDMKDTLAYLESQPVHDKVVFTGNSKDKLLELLSSFYQTIEASGGLVWDQDGRLLVILRNGVWDLPKGKIEKGESEKRAAIREVSEECGIQSIELKELIQLTFHTYKQKKDKILKKTYWYEMICNDPMCVKPQLEEGITDIKWMNRDEIEEIKEGSYQNLQSLFNYALNRMA